MSDMVRESHGLEQLVAIVKDKNMRENKSLLAAATGALWKCTLVEDNVRQLDNVSGLYYFLHTSRINHFQYHQLHSIDNIFSAFLASYFKCSRPTFER